MNPNPTIRPREVSFEAVREAWLLLNGNVWPWIVAALLPFGGLFGLMAVGSFAIEGVDSNPMLGADPTESDFFGIFVWLGLLASLFLAFGSLNMALMHLKTGTADLRQMFRLRGVILSLVISTLLCGLCCVLGTILFILPGIYAAVALVMTPFVILDQKAGPLKAMMQSWKAVTPHWLMVLLLLLSGFLLTLMGCAFFFVGYLLMAPLAQLTMTIVYRDLIGTQPSQLAPAVTPRSPIADPNG